MSHRERILNCQAYIDSHINEDISIQELAKRYGYSLYYFCRIFKSFSDTSVAAYIRQRRLELAAADILNGRPVAEVSAVRGFDTPSGFAKAFRKQFSVSPTEYKARSRGNMLMIPEIKKLAAFSAVGYCLAPPDGDLDILDAGAYWEGKDFSSVSKQDYDRLMSPGGTEIGTWLHPSDTAGNFFYFFGPIVEDKTFIPKGMKAIDIPEAEYAVFKIPFADGMKALSENVRKSWKYIYTEWFDNGGYTLDESKMSFEYYIGTNTYLYVPVLEK
jgi:AraC family transcriptional regulator